MSDKKTRANWEKKRGMERGAGFNLKPSAIRIHSSDETPKHLLVKSMLALVLQNRERQWDTEVKGPGGRVDVLDLGPTDGKPVIYEVETDVTDTQARKKANQYAGEHVRDVIVIDPDDVPDTPTEAYQYLDREVL